MSDVTETKRKFLNSLMQDCIRYRMMEREGREYVDQ